MRRFAVAQLGSLWISQGRWSTIFCTNWNSKYPEFTPIDDVTNVFRLATTDVLRTDACNIAAMALAVLESEGSKFLYLTEPHVPQEHKDMMNRIYNPLPQLTWRGSHGSQTHPARNPHSH